jgi:hypothetical protein
VTGEGASGGDASGGGVTGDEAAWRDLVARYEMPAEWDATSVPWPDRENLTEGSSEDPAVGPVPGHGPVREGGAGPGSSGPGSASPASAGGASPASAGGAGPASPGGAGPASPGGAGRADAGPASAGPADAGPASAGPAGPGGVSAPGSAADRTRVIRPATPPRGPDPAPAPEPVADPPEDEDEHFIPPAPPPLPHLDSVAKGAWAALFGGPAYLVLASIIGWNVPGWAALVAVMAFVGGFAIVVLRLGDGPSRGDGPDNGAVI